MISIVLQLLFIIHNTLIIIFPELRFWRYHSSPNLLSIKELIGISKWWELSLVIPKQFKQLRVSGLNAFDSRQLKHF